MTSINSEVMVWLDWEMNSPNSCTRGTRAPLLATMPGCDWEDSLKPQSQVQGGFFNSTSCNLLLIIFITRRLATTEDYFVVIEIRIFRWYNAIGYNTIQLEIVPQVVDYNNCHWLQDVHNTRPVCIQSGLERVPWLCCYNTLLPIIPQFTHPTTEKVLS